MREFRQWQLFAQIDPFGEEREDLRTAFLICNVFRKLGDKNVKVEDFMIGKIIEKGQQSTSQMAINFAVFAAKHNTSLKK